MLRKIVCLQGLVLVLAGGTFEAVSAQSSVSPGQRIRATLVNGGQLTGIVTNVYEFDSLSMVREDRTERLLGVSSENQVRITLSADDIQLVEVSVGTVAGTRRGAVIGGAAGAGFGVLVGVFSWGFALPVAVVSYGATGAAVGAVYGYFFMSPHIYMPIDGWVPAPDYASVGLGPALQSNFAPPMSPVPQGMSTEFQVPVSSLLSLFGFG